jgi:CMP-N,N'-diacetyllegionaminic acid synthase
MKILALILARGGSKRLPGKNIRPLDEKPLIAWTIRLAKQIPDLVDVMVSTDDAGIASVARAEGALIPWLRPAELSTDLTPSIDAVLHALDWYEDENGKADGVLLLQPTSPFRRLTSVLYGIKLFESKYPCSVIGVSTAESHPAICFYNSNGQLKPVLGTLENPQIYARELPSAYVVNGGFYLSSSSNLRERRTFYTEPLYPLVMNEKYENLDIDTEDDWEYAEFIISRSKNFN